MPLFKKKAILKVGDHQSPDGTLSVTPERLKHWADQFAAMQASGLRMPSAFNHATDPKDALPVTVDPGKDPSAQDGVGWLAGFQVAEDGKSAELMLDLRDDAAVDKASKDLVEVSPVIFSNWKDGSGNVWKDVITHVDLVLHPVEGKQAPFERVEEQQVIACSLRTGLDIGKPQVYRMATDNENEEVEDTKTASETEETDENPDLPKEGGEKADDQQLKAVLAHLPAHGLALPADTDQTNFVERLLVALLTAEAARAKKDDEQETEEDPMASATESSPAFQAMSLRANTAHAFAERQYRGSLQSRLDDLLKSGRCTPAEHEQHKSALGAVRLSLSKDGEPNKSGVEKFMESREVLPVGAAWDPQTRVTRMGQSVQEATAPRELTGDEISDAEAEQLVDRIFKKHKPASSAA